MWRADLHPRDEYGRFRLKGAGGVLDRVAGAMTNQQHARNIAEVEALWQKQFNYYQPLQATGQLTPELDAQWDRDIKRRRALEKQLPPAHHKDLVPHDDGIWRKPDAPNDAHQIYDEKGRRLPPMVAKGAVRVGDSPNGAPGYALSREEEVDYEEMVDLIERNGVDRFANERTISPLWGGAWHQPGEYGPGRVPILRNDVGHEIGRLRPEPARSRRHRQRAGTLARAEYRGEMVGRRWADAGAFPGTSYREYERPSDEVAGAQMISPLNPTSRRRSARVKRKREQTVTWIQRVNAQMEDRSRG
jgi:hypothetical protein